MKKTRKKNKIRRDTKIDRIEDGIVYYKDKGVKIHSPETKLKMSKARKKRKSQPRAGTSKKAKNLYEQIRKDFVGQELTKKQKKSIDTFLQKNKKSLDITSSECLKQGFYSDYQQNIFNNMELSLLGGSEILFDNNGDRTNEFEYEIDFSIDLDIFKNNLDKEISDMKGKYSEEYINAYKETELYIHNVNQIYSLPYKDSKKMVDYFIQNNNYTSILGANYY